MPTVKPQISEDGVTRLMTDAEYAQWQTDKAESEAQAEAQAAKIALRQTVLDKLGLTADEAAALFG